MARVPMIAGNWKMNTLRAEARSLFEAIHAASDGVRGVDKVVCPPALFLHDAGMAFQGSTLHVGAQNLYWEEKGAYTGELSVTQVAEAAEFVITGHSERRQLFGETDATVNRRVIAALSHGLKPIMCVGESLEERQAGETTRVLVRQTREGLANVAISANFIVAYEPVWAIGSGLAADPTVATEAIAQIRSTLRDLAGDVADSVRVLYGGSVTPDNIAEFMMSPEIDGGLIGGASLKADSFARLIEAAAASASSA